MSASTERKTRQAAREAGTDKKTLAMEKEAAKKAKSDRRWKLGTAAAVLFVALVLILNSSLVYKATAFTVGDRSYNASEVSYRYANGYYNLVNQYASIISYIGLDTSNGIRGLDKQESMYGGTWKDYFLQQAEDTLTQATILNQYAAEKGITLDADDYAKIDEAFEGLDETARSNGYASGDKLLAMNYGTGVNEKLIRAAYEQDLLAAKASEALSDSFTYTEEQLEEKYRSFEGSQDYFDYAYCYVNAETEETEGADGEPVYEPTEQSLADAEATGEAIAEAYRASKGENYAERFIAAAEAEGQSGSEHSHIQGSGVPAYDWMRDASRKAGDITVEPDASGCYVVVFLGRDDNHYHAVNVRHILIKAEADEEGSYSDEAKAAAKARAEEILAEYDSGDRTEESFAALAEEYSEDTGSNTNGGLYENVSKGQMVREFNDFCFAEHKVGDTGIVYGESGSYAGYHVMYYAGEGELYSNVLAENELRSEDVSAWMEAAEAANPTKEGFGIKLVG